MVKWEPVYTRQAVKDAKRVAAAGHKEKAIELLRLIERDLFQVSPPDEKLLGDLAGAHSKRIHIQDRLVYLVLKKERLIKIIRLWTHYE